MTARESMDAEQVFSDAELLAIIRRLEQSADRIPYGFEIKTMVRQGALEMMINYVPCVRETIASHVYAIRISSPVMVDESPQWVLICQGRDQQGWHHVSYGGVLGLVFQEGASPRALFNEACRAKEVTTEPSALNEDAHISVSLPGTMSGWVSTPQEVVLVRKAQADGIRSARFDWDYWARVFSYFLAGAIGVFALIATLRFLQ